MRFLSPIPARLVRILVMSLVFAFCVLWAIERTAKNHQLELIGDPMTPSSMGVGHPHLLWEMPPGETEVNGQRVQVNNIGARGPEIALKKTTGIRRILSLGGDIAFGSGVQRSETYTVDAVSNLGGTRVGVEAVLLAVPEYTIEQTRNLMAMRGWALEPNLLILSGPGHEMDVRPYVDSSVVSSFEGNRRLNRLLGETALYRILDHWIRVKSGPKAQRRLEAFRDGLNLNLLGLPRVGTNAYAHHLDSLVETSIEKDTDVVFVMLPVPADLTTSPDGRVKLYREAMSHVASRHGVPIVDGPTLFRESGRQETTLFGNERTLTKRGHRILSYALAQKLRPWMRGRKLNKKGTGAEVPTLREPEPDGDAQ